MWKPSFNFKEHSPFKVKSEPQERMIRAIKDANGKSGLIVAPCGSGKSAVLLEAAMEAGTMVLIFCYESQGVKQIAKDLREHTTLMDAQICLFTGKHKKKLNSRFCYLVTTYGMFAGPEARRNAASRDVRDFVFNTEWDLICCDEAHHMGADTYQPMIEKLKAKRKLGFTATPYRSELFSATQDRDAHVDNAFGWFGPVLVRISWREVEAAGLIAKIGRARLDVELTAEFRTAYEMAMGSQKRYIAALNPVKLSALVAVCAIHGAMNHGGIVFVTHLVTATVVQRLLQRCFGEGWEVLSGGSAHGEEATHTADQNAAIVDRFNDGQLKGLICTNVAAGAMDIPECAFAVDLDTDGGRANTEQRHGRVARTPRVHPKPDESAAELLARRLDKQKEAWYYDFVTRGTEDEAAAARRHQFFVAEGYGEEIAITTEGLLSDAQACDATLPYVSLGEQMVLLKEVLRYNALKGVCVEANAAVAKAKVPHSGEVRRLEEKHARATNALMRTKMLQEIGKAKKQQQLATAQAKVVRRQTIDDAPLNKNSYDIFRALRLSIHVLEEADMLDAAFAPSDDERGDDE